MLNNHRMRIFLVDNEPMVIKTLRDFLFNLGYEIVSVESPCELLNKLEKETKPVDLIIVDFHMPKESVTAMVREVHKRYPDVAMVLLTNNSPILSACDAISYGVYAYLRKPIYFAELELLLMRLSENHEKWKSI